MPPGYVISTAACRDYLDRRRLPDGLVEEIYARLAALEQATGKTFGGGPGAVAALGAVGRAGLHARHDGHDPQPGPLPRRRRSRSPPRPATAASWPTCVARFHAMYAETVLGALDLGAAARSTSRASRRRRTCCGWRCGPCRRRCSGSRPRHCSPPSRWTGYVRRGLLAVDPRTAIDPSVEGAAGQGRRGSRRGAGPAGGAAAHRLGVRGRRGAALRSASAASRSTPARPGRSCSRSARPRSADRVTLRRHPPGRPRPYRPAQRPGGISAGAIGAGGRRRHRHAAAQSLCASRRRRGRCDATTQSVRSFASGSGRSCRLRRADRRRPRSPSVPPCRRAAGAGSPGPEGRTARRRRSRRTLPTAASSLSRAGAAASRAGGTGQALAAGLAAVIRAGAGPRRRRWQARQRRRRAGGPRSPAATARRTRPRPRSARRPSACPTPRRPTRIPASSASRTSPAVSVTSTVLARIGVAPRRPSRRSRRRSGGRLRCRRRPGTRAIAARLSGATSPPNTCAKQNARSLATSTRRSTAIALDDITASVQSAGEPAHHVGHAGHQRRGVVRCAAAPGTPPSPGRRAASSRQSLRIEREDVAAEQVEVLLRAGRRPRSNRSLICRKISHDATRVCTRVPSRSKITALAGGPCHGGHGFGCSRW